MTEKKLLRLLCIIIGFAFIIEIRMIKIMCDDYYEVDFVEKLGHSYINTYIEPTCTTNLACCLNRCPFPSMLVEYPPPETTAEAYPLVIFVKMPLDTETN